MKKTLLVFLAIALVSSFAFAEAVVGGEASISGSVSLTAGYDLDNESYGFVNDSDIQIVLPILGGDAGASGDDGVYGEIMIEDLGWEWNLDERSDGGAWDSDEEDPLIHASISATIHFNGLYLGLGEPDFGINNVDVSDDYLVDANADADLITGGFTLGFANDMIDISLMVASENDYRDDTDDDIDTVDTDDDHRTPFANENDDGDADDDYEANVNGELVFGVAATITPMDGVTVPLSFFFDPKSDAVTFDIGTNSTGAQLEDLMAFGMAPSIEMGAFTLDLPVDYVSYGSKNAFELEPTVGYEAMEGLEIAARFLYGSYTGVLAADVDDSVAFPAEGAVGFDIANAVSELAVSVTDTEAFVPGLEWMLEVTMIDLMDYENTAYAYTNMDIDVEASYATGGMKPYMTASYSLADSEMDLGLGVELGADFTGIDNTVITIDYDNEALVNGLNADYGADTDVTESGRLTVDFTVSF